MNIALLSQSFNSYSETFIQNHKNNLPGKVFYYYGGHIPTMIEGVSLPLKEIYKKNILLNGIQHLLGKNKSNLELLEKSFLDNNIDMIFAEFGHVGANILQISTKLNLPLIVVWHGYEISAFSTLKKYEKKYLQFANSNAKHLIVAKAMKEKLLNFRVPEENIYFSPMPASEVFLQNKPSFLENNLLFIGRFTDKKAPYNLILAMQIVLKSIPTAKLYMIGDGELFNSCLNLTKNLNLDKNIFLLGSQSHEEIHKQLENTSIYIQHSITALSGDSEGTPVSIMEASLAALPVVSTLHSGIPDVILNEETGFLVEENKIQEFAEKIIYLLNNKEKARIMGEKGREYISENFSLDKHLEVINTIITSFK